MNIYAKIAETTTCDKDIPHFVEQQDKNQTPRYTGNQSSSPEDTYLIQQNRWWMFHPAG